MQLICWYSQLTAMCIVQNECSKPNLFTVKALMMEPIVRATTRKCLSNSQEYPRLSYNTATALMGFFVCVPPSVCSDIHMSLTHTQAKLSLPCRYNTSRHCYCTVSPLQFWLLDKWREWNLFKYEHSQLLGVCRSKDRVALTAHHLPVHLYQESSVNWSAVPFCWSLPFYCNW